MSVHTPAVPVAIACPSACAPARKLASLRFRRDFLRAAAARRQHAAGLLLQARARLDNEPGEAAIRVGFTCSRKIGNAVTRNRAKRRLREAARLLLPGLGKAGWDYVLVGRPGATVARDFAALCADLEAALKAIHAQPSRGPSSERPRA